MADNIQRSRGIPQNYRMDRGGVPTHFGPFIGVVMNNIDPTRSGRLQVYIQTFADGDLDDESKWVTVNYLPNFFGVTPKASSNEGTGTYPGNRNSYGMWFTPPDVGIKVLCIFADGDRDKGYYIGVIPEQGTNHMVPAIGAATNFDQSNTNQEVYFQNATQLPVTEINDTNTSFISSPTFFDKVKPVHSRAAAALYQQGLIEDIERGPISSAANRETPSQSFGIATPGRPIYQGGRLQEQLISLVQSDNVKPQDLKVIGRTNGHTFVMDDGALDGRDSLIRLRTSKGHQITMSDSGNFFYFIHANGQTWIELGQEGTVDVFSTNSVNIRSQGEINLHADADINIFAGGNFNVKSVNGAQLETEKDLVIRAKANMTIYGLTIGVKSDGTLALDSAQGSWLGGSELKFTADGIDFNGPAATFVSEPNALVETVLPDVKFTPDSGFEETVIRSIVTRAPSHEPWPLHNQGVDVQTSIQDDVNAPPPGTEPLPPGVVITVESE